MRWLAVLVPVLLVASPARPRAATPETQLSEEERQFCESEVEVLERRRKVFESQGLSPAEIARKNADSLGFLTECRERFRAEQRRSLEQKADLEEVARRVGANATEKERDAAWKEIRRERLASKSPASLTPEERAELAAGTDDEVATTHAALDSAHARDPAFMRVVNSALACYHRDRKGDLENQISSEAALVKLGSGDRQKLYALRSELRQSEGVLARIAETSRPAELERCAAPTVAVVSHCLAVRFQGGRKEPACESEEIQQYVRFVK